MSSDGLIKDLEGAFRVIKNEERLARRIRELTSGQCVDLSKLKTEEGEDQPVLHLACESGNPVAVSVLLKKFDARLDIMTKAGTTQDTAFHRAAVGGSAKVLQILMDELRLRDPSSAKLNVADVGNRYNRTPLHLALEAGQLETARYLIGAPVNVHAEDMHGFKMLHFAAKSGSVAALEEVVRATRVDVNVTSNDNITPLHWAALQGNVDAVDWLLRHGADLTVADHVLGWLPLHYAARRLQIDVVELLLRKAGTNPFATGKNGKTVVDMVCKIDKSEKKRQLKMLLEKMQVLKNIFLSEHMIKYVARYGSNSTNNWLENELTAEYLRETGRKLVKKVRLLECAAGSDNVEAVQHLVHLIRTLLKETDKGEFLDQLKCALQHALQFGTLDFAKALALELQDEEKVHLGDWVSDLKEKFLERMTVPLKQLWRDFQLSQESDKHSGRLWGWGKNRYHCEEKNLPGQLPFAFILAWIRTMPEKSVVEATAEFIEHQNLWDHIGFSSNVDNTKKNALHWAVLLVKPAVVDELLKIKVCEAEAVAGDENDKTPHELAVVAHRLFTLAADRADAKDEKRELVAMAKHLENIKIKMQVESQPVKDLNDLLHRDRTLSVEALNAILVGSALLAGITFQGVLQQPTTKNRTGLNIFAVFNSLSFFFGMASAVIGATGVLPKRDEYIGHLLKDLRSKLTLAAGLLIISIAFVLVAFASAGFGTIHPSFRYASLVTTGIGGTLCLYMLAAFMRRIYLLWGLTEGDKESSMQKLAKKVGFRPPREHKSTTGWSLC